MSNKVKNKTNKQKSIHFSFGCCSLDGETALWEG